MNSSSSVPVSKLRWWQPVLFGALAGGLGWGIRGQYGHETGAMIAGVLVGLTLLFLFRPDAPLLGSARAVAWFTVAIGLGGSMTYGQTIGLTQNAPLVGHWEAWRWGMLGLAIKGGIWIGFGGVFLGMGLSGVRYRVSEIAVLMIGLLLLFLAGKWLLNEPFDPAHRILPRIYFSEAWRWAPGAELKPRREVWGGLLLGLLGLLAYLRAWRADILAWRVALWAVLGGVLGFPLGQCLQSYHAWNLESFRSGEWSNIDSVINWWNMMETTFGAIMGATLGLGLWFNRARLPAEHLPQPVSISPRLEWALVLGYVYLLILGEFGSPPAVIEPVLDLGLAMGVVPMLAIAGGKWWPFLAPLPITLIPIAGKTIRQLCYKEPVSPPWAGWLVYGVCPLLLMLGATWWAVQQLENERGARTFFRWTLLLTVWVYFSLNFAFFRFPWVWVSWTYRTPNGIIYTLCAVGLSWAAWRLYRPRVGDAPA